jgi:hypothetical protein
MDIQRLIKKFDAQIVLRLAHANGAGSWIEKHLVA